jgi:hypothetical protein
VRSRGRRYGLFSGRPADPESLFSSAPSTGKAPITDVQRASARIASISRGRVSSLWTQVGVDCPSGQLPVRSPCFALSRHRSRQSQRLHRNRKEAYVLELERKASVHDELVAECACLPQSRPPSLIAPHRLRAENRALLKIIVSGHAPPQSTQPALTVAHSALVSPWSESSTPSVGDDYFSISGSRGQVGALASSYEATAASSGFFPPQGTAAPLFGTTWSAPGDLARLAEDYLGHGAPRRSWPYSRF